MRFGAHTSTAGGVWKALERARSIGAEIVQVFVKNNMQWFGKPIAGAAVTRYKALEAGWPAGSIFGHTGYLINLAAPPSQNRLKSIQSLIQEIQLADQLGIPFLVMHPGAHLGQGEPLGLSRAAEGLDQVFSATSKSAVRIALETTAGQGTCLGHAIAHLQQVYKQVHYKSRLGACLDTAHLFEAGYNIRRRRTWNVLLSEIDDRLGLDQILAVHLNDSKTPCGSRVDRHAGIGQGHIGLDGFRHIVNDPRLAGLPGCLETPKSPDLHEDVENLARLRSLQLKAAKKVSPGFSRRQPDAAA